MTKRFRSAFAAPAGFVAAAGTKAPTNEALRAGAQRQPNASSGEGIAQKTEPQRLAA